MNVRESGNSRNFLGEDILSERERGELYQVGIRSRHALVTEIEEVYDARRLAKEIEIAAPRLVDLWRLAQLQQVHGVGDSTAKLLLRAGVRSVADLSRRNPDRLHEELERVNRQDRVLSMSPRKRDILRWIRRAKRLIKFKRAE